MKVQVGVTLWFQNMPDLIKQGIRPEYAVPPVKLDTACIQDELRLANLIEPLGFDKMWTIEHHFTPYGLTPSPLMLFAYMAGRTERIGFGNMVLILPWHDPVRLAGEIATLDCLLNGRPLTLGVGRGAAPQEFAGFRSDYSKSRERMTECLDIIRLGLTQEWFEYDGEIFKIPRTTIRPRPLSADLTKNMRMAWSSPDTMKLAGNSGLAPLFNNFSNWDDVRKQNDEYNAMRAAHGWHPTVPTCAGPVFCSTDKDEVKRAREWTRMTMDSALWHYGILHQPSMRPFLAGKTGKDLEDAINSVRDKYLNVGAYGSPDEVTDTLLKAQKITGFGELICQMNTGMMPYDTAEKSMRLFAKEVLPVLKAVDAGSTVATPYSQINRDALSEAS